MNQPYRAGRVLSRALLLVLAGAVLGGVNAMAQVSFAVNKILQVEATGTGSENCNGLKSTLLSLASPSVNNRYLIRLEPGRYHCAAVTLALPRGVAIEGAGSGLTTISGLRDNPLLGVVHMVDGTELRSLTVWNTHSSTPPTKAIAVSAWEFGSTPTIKLEEVVLRSPGSGSRAALHIINTTAEVSRSELKNELWAEAGSQVTAKYSNLDGGYYADLSTQITCRFCTNGPVELNTVCVP